MVRNHIFGDGVNDLIFELYHALGFAFVPLSPDLGGRYLYDFIPAKPCGVGTRWWLPPTRDDIAMCQNDGVKPSSREGQPRSTIR
ncbi:MAG: hypothetical protein QM744_14885 [Mesorhizobium sp.]